MPDPRISESPRRWESILRQKLVTTCAEPFPPLCFTGRVLGSGSLASGVAPEVGERERERERVGIRKLSLSLSLPPPGRPRMRESQFQGHVLQKHVFRSRYQGREGFSTHCYKFLPQDALPPPGATPKFGDMILSSPTSGATPKNCVWLSLDTQGATQRIGVCKRGWGPRQRHVEAGKPSTDASSALEHR